MDSHTHSSVDKGKIYVICQNLELLQLQFMVFFYRITLVLIIINSISFTIFCFLVKTVGFEADLIKWTCVSSLLLKSCKAGLQYTNSLRILLELNVVIYGVYLKPCLAQSKYSANVSHNSNNNLISIVYNINCNCSKCHFLVFSYTIFYTLVHNA